MILLDKTTFNSTFSLDNSFECDAIIAPIIALLNIKGYTTTFCCEGHWEWLDNSHTSATIDIPYITFEVGLHLPSVPEGWVKYVDTESLTANDEIIEGYWESLRPSKLEDSENELIFNAYKIEALYNLLKWTESLPNIF